MRRMLEAVSSPTGLQGRHSLRASLEKRATGLCFSSEVFCKLHALLSQDKILSDSKARHWEEPASWHRALQLHLQLDRRAPHPTLPWSPTPSHPSTEVEEKKDEKTTSVCPDTGTPTELCSQLPRMGTAQMPEALSGWANVTADTLPRMCPREQGQTPAHTRQVVSSLQTSSPPPTDRQTDRQPGRETQTRPPRAGPLNLDRVLGGAPPPSKHKNKQTFRKHCRPPLTWERCTLSLRAPLWDRPEPGASPLPLGT